MNRRELLAIGLASTLPSLSWSETAGAKPKRVIIAGAGLAGLTCAYELNKRGHDVVVLEASDHTGGHVQTLREGLPDGLYADVGAEHFTKPGYDLCWKYFKELNLPVMAYPHRENILRVLGGRMVEAREAHALEMANLGKQGFSDRELRYLRQQPSGNLQVLYFERYIDRIRDEYKPIGVGLDELDAMTVSELLQREGASAAAIEQFGSGKSALHTIWKLAIFRLRKTDEDPRSLFRLRGGNQGLPDALAAKLGNKIHTASPVVAIRHSNTAVEVTCSNDKDDSKVFEADYLVCCVNAVILRELKVTPAWPSAKHFAIANVPYSVETRPVFVSKTKFWKSNGYSGNMEFGTPILGPLWPMAQEVPTERGLMIGTSQGGITADMALKVFHRYYPGKADIESARVVDWSRHRWSMTCEAQTYGPGQLLKMWPAVIAPIGRVHFAGAYCDNQSWGMEAATRSGMRAARAVHEA